MRPGLERRGEKHQQPFWNPEKCQQNWKNLHQISSLVAFDKLFHWHVVELLGVKQSVQTVVVHGAGRVRSGLELDIPDWLLFCFWHFCFWIGVCQLWLMIWIHLRLLSQLSVCIPLVNQTCLAMNVATRLGSARLYSEGVGIPRGLWTIQLLARLCNLIIYVFSEQ